MSGVLRPLWSILFILLFTNAFATEPGKRETSDSLVLNHVKNSEINALDTILIDGVDINDQFGEDKRTLLTYAIESRQYEVTEFLITRGADIEKKDGSKTPLMFAARYGRAEFTKLLLEKGADINSINRDRNTAFHYAAKYNNFEVLKILYENGAKINIPNKDQWTALDYSIINSRPQIREYLESIGCILFEKDIPDYFDGPYISLTDDSTLKFEYLVNKRGRKGSSLLSKDIITKGLVSINGLKKDREEYKIISEPSIPPSQYEMPSQLFVMGDIHGQYERMIEMLRSGGVISKNNDWTFGDGHLLFVGDILDRGEGVMEALWLIYQLEQQAELENGKVHLLLGNHEAMIIKDDIRYIANKYYCLTSNLGINYVDLFSDRTIIGRWLKTKNVVEIIGNTMFVHAGISPELASKDLSIDEINSGFRHFLQNSDKSKYSDMDSFLISNYGPVWYRGYLKGSGSYKEINQSALESILEKYSVDQVVVGHTEVDLIDPIKNKKVFPVNIPLAKKDIKGQALLIEDGEFYRLDTNKSITKLK